MFSVDARHLSDLTHSAIIFVSILLGIALTGCAFEASPRVQKVPVTHDRDIETSLFLVGDAGKPALGGEPVMQALTRVLQSSRGEPFVVFLGDNVYPSGLPAADAPERLAMEKVLDIQIQAILKTRAQGVFIPGNHDWDHSGKDGWAKVRMQDAFVDRLGQGRVRMLPDQGCPGPRVEDIGDRLRLVFLDTQWWLHPGPKPVDAASGCQTYTAQAIGVSLSKVLNEAGSRHVVVAAHHPLRSSSRHGGYFTWKEHLFPFTSLKPWLYIPLPLLGSIYPLSRQLGINDQDLAGRANREMRAVFGEAMRANPPLIFAGGHEHTLEIHEGAFSHYALVSGAGVFGRVSPVSDLDTAIFTTEASGFLRLDIMQDGRVRLGVITVDAEANASESFSMFLKHR